MAFEQYWEDTYKKRSGERPYYDDWLDQYYNLIKPTRRPILDLGCGLGNDSLYLSKKGFDVISCDYSEEALKNVKKIVSNAKTQNIDISKKLPFNDCEFNVIIADLSLHYFDYKTTMNIMHEIKRVLNVGGILLARVSSVNDYSHGAGMGEEIENNYYFVGGYNKRFFSLEDVNQFFSIIGKVEAKESDILRYGKIKKFIEVKVMK